MASAFLSLALAEISDEPGANQTTTDLSVALYMLIMAFFPLWWSSGWGTRQSSRYRYGL